MLQFSLPDVKCIVTIYCAPEMGSHSKGIYQKNNNVLFQTLQYIPVWAKWFL